MNIGFYLNSYDEDFISFLNNINFNFFVFSKSKEEKELQYRNVLVIKSENISDKIKENKIDILFLDKDLDVNIECIKIKIIDNEIEKEIYKNFEFFAIRGEKSEKYIYFPYFVDFQFFNQFENKILKFKEFEKYRRITILSKDLSFEFFELLRILAPLSKKHIFQIYGLFDKNFVNQKNFVFIKRNLEKEKRAELYYFSDLIICINNFKKEVLEAMSMGKNVFTLDGFSGIKFEINQKLIKKIEKALEIEDINEYAIEIAKEFDIKKSAKIFEKELIEKIPKILTEKHL